MIIDMTNETEHARFLRCIGEPTRMRIIKLLSQGEKCVGDICEEIGKDQPLVSHHLRVLKECGIVSSRSETQKHYCRLADPILAELLTVIENVVTKLKPCQAESVCCEDEGIPDSTATELTQAMKGKTALRRYSGD